MEQLLRILRETCPGVDFEQEQALIDNGLIDSLDIVSIVSEIMDAYSVEIGVDDLVPENFNSVASIHRMIERRRA